MSKYSPNFAQPVLFYLALNYIAKSMMNAIIMFDLGVYLKKFLMKI